MIDHLLSSPEPAILLDGGFPAEARHYKTSRKIELGADVVDWGETSKHVGSPWITVDALTVLRNE